MRTFIQLKNLPAGFESALRRWASGREVACVLQGNRNIHDAGDPYSAFDTCVAADAVEEIKDCSPVFESLRDFHDQKKDWLFGYFSYDLKNQIEHLRSGNFDGLGFPAVHFFRPAIIFLKRNDGWKAGFHEENASAGSVLKLVEEINSLEQFPDAGIDEVQIKQRVTEKDYQSIVGEIKKHIQRGNIYEMNYCMEFYADNATIQPLSAYEKLNEISPMPFSCYYKNGLQHLVCASPERFLARRGRKIISQPIKGTARRGMTKAEDEALIQRLRRDIKEQSENVMIVDLVRNDLSRTAARKSVKVEELCGIYSFSQLHQMISTVVSEMREDVHWTEVIRHAFPMGSMTGAPKIRAMQLIEEFEASKRGLYSGAVGYVNPEGDFDFNVVIRSILYNEAVRYLSFMVGSAITINSDGKQEYEECLLKAKAILQVLHAKKAEKQSDGIAAAV